NWLPIDTAKDYNYTLNGEDLIMRTISTTAINDTTFFETILDTCTNCTPGYQYSTRQADFFGFYLISNFDTSYTYYGEDTFVLKPLKNLGENWMFNSNKVATVVGLEERVFDSQIDSVKLITIGNLDTLILSKSFGIIEFPDLKRDKQYIQLGIDETYGTQNISFEEIYNYEIGDVFQYVESYANPDDNYKWYFKITILDKQQITNYFIYDIFLEERRENGENGNISPYTASSFTTTSITNTDFLLQLQTGSWASFFNTSSVSDPLLVSSYYYKDSLNMLVKAFDSKFRISSELLAVDCITLSGDSVGRHDGNCFDHIVEYQVGLGKIRDLLSYFETGHSTILIGYDKGFGVVGKIYEDDFYTSNNDVLDAKELISIYPNPAKEMLYFELTNPSLLSIQILNPLGELVLEKEISENQSISIENFASGLYFVQTCTKENICAINKLIIR
ncbi:MAG: hypothetical protein ACI89M_002257, partial [Chitinophagales bacterium]